MPETRTDMHISRQRSEGKSFGRNKPAEERGVFDGERTRVLLVIQSLEIGGSERQCVEMAAHLAESGYGVSVACLRATGPLKFRLIEAGIPLVEFPVSSLWRPNVLLQAVRFAKFLRKGQFHVVQANDVYANLFAVPIARLMGVPVVISSQRDLSHWSWYTPLRRKVLRRVQAMSSCVIVNSDAIRENLMAEGDVLEGKIKVLYNGINAKRFIRTAPTLRGPLIGVSSSDRRIVMVANMHIPVKGHSDLIAAAHVVCQKHSDVRFLLIGDGEIRHIFEQQVREMRLERSVLFLGHRTDVPDVLSACEIGVLASRAEGLPNAVLEYMAAGLAPVATAVGGIPEIIQHEKTGLIVPAQNAAALSEAILRLLEDEELRLRLASAAQKFVQANFDFTSVVAKLSVLYGRDALGVRTGERTHSSAEIRSRYGQNKYSITPQ